MPVLSNPLNAGIDFSVSKNAKVMEEDIFDMLSRIKVSFWVCDHLISVANGACCDEISPVSAFNSPLSDGPPIRSVFESKSMCCIDVIDSLYLRTKGSITLDSSSSVKPTMTTETEIPCKESSNRQRHSSIISPLSFKNRFNVNFWLSNSTVSLSSSGMPRRTLRSVGTIDEMYNFFASSLISCNMRLFFALSICRVVYFASYMHFASLHRVKLSKSESRFLFRDFSSNCSFDDNSMISSSFMFNSRCFWLKACFKVVFSVLCVSIAFSTSSICSLNSSNLVFFSSTVAFKSSKGASISFNFDSNSSERVSSYAFNFAVVSWDNDSYLDCCTFKDRFKSSISFLAVSSLKFTTTSSYSLFNSLSNSCNSDSNLFSNDWHSNVDSFSFNLKVFKF